MLHIELCSGPLIMIHAWVHLSRLLSPHHTKSVFTAGHSITSDSVSPICVTGTKTYDSPPQPVSEVINFSSSRCGDGSAVSSSGPGPGQVTADPGKLLSSSEPGPGQVRVSQLTLST